MPEPKKKQQASRFIGDGSECVLPSDPRHAQVVADIEERQRWMREQAEQRRREKAAKPDAG
jgi:hypothetical protein